MHVFALDKDFKLVTTGIPYDNLQWVRRYYDAGEFMLQLPLSIYNPSWAYIGMPDRQEIGMVQKMEYSNSDTILLSGFFAEKMLDWKAIYPKFVPKRPSSLPGTTVHFDVNMVATQMFNANKGDLPIYEGNMGIVELADDAAGFSAVDDKLGERMYSFLESYEASYKVYYDYDMERLYFETWKGKDRTTSQTTDYPNPYQMFSDEFGNIGTRSATFDDSGYYNYAIVPADADEDGKERETLYVDLSDGGFKRETVIDMRSSSVSDDQTMEQWRGAVIQEAREQLLNYSKVEDVNIHPLSDKGYLQDYDLGDKIEAKLTKIGVSLESRIVEVNEVFKADGGHEITLGLGNKRITNIGRAVMR